MIKRQPRLVHNRFTSPSHAVTRIAAQRGLLRPLVWSLTRVTVLGTENLKTLAGGFVVIANHASHLDTPLIVGALPRQQVRYLAVGAAADYFFDVWWRRGLTALFFNAFPVQRSGSGRRAISARSLVESGVPVLLFPEGTRSIDGELGPFKPGAAALAASCRVPCLPIALIGAHLAQPRGTNWPKSGRPPVGVVFGEPMLCGDDENAEDFTKRLKQEIIRLRTVHSPQILGAPTTEEGAQR